MESLLILGSITLALMLGAISPGPTFIYVAKNSIAISRKHGLFTALGTGTGAALLMQVGTRLWQSHCQQKVLAKFI